MDILQQDDNMQKMNEILSGREKIFEEREKRLADFREELRTLEADILREKEELKKTWTQIDDERKKITKREEMLQEREKELEGQWEAIRQEREKMLHEKMEMEAMQNERLRIENEKEAWELENARAALGIMNPGSAAVHPDPQNVSEPGTEDPELISDVDPAQDALEASGTVEALSRFREAAKQVFPEGTILECGDQVFRIQVADKEIRIHKGDLFSATIQAGREETRELQKGIAQINRKQQEWVFSYTGGYLKCEMPFTSKMEAATVLKKCADAMERYFK